MINAALLRGLHRTDRNPKPRPAVLIPDNPTHPSSASADSHLYWRHQPFRSRASSGSRRAVLDICDGLWNLSYSLANVLENVEFNTSHPLCTFFAALGSTLQSLTVLFMDMGFQSMEFIAKTCRSLRHLKLTMTGECPTQRAQKRYGAELEINFERLHQ